MRATVALLASAALLAGTAFLAGTTFLARAALLMGAFTFSMACKEAVEEVAAGVALSALLASTTTLLLGAAVALLASAALLVSAAAEQAAFLVSTVAFATLLAGITTTFLLGTTVTFLVGAATALLSCAAVALLARTTAALLGRTVLLSSIATQIHHAIEQIERACVGGTSHTEEASSQQRRQDRTTFHGRAPKSEKPHTGGTMFQIADPASQFVYAAVERKYPAHGSATYLLNSRFVIVTPACHP